MIDLPAPLDADDCPLLKRYGDSFDTTLKLYNEAQAIAAQLKNQHRAHFEDEDVQKHVKKLAELRERLRRRRFRVGFLGPFQCGKSTLINKLLKRKVSGTGNASACTSVVTRIVMDREAAEPPTLELRYFTFNEYLDRRTTLCDWAQLPNSKGMTEEAILKRLENHRPTGESGRRPVLKDDVPFLKSFLRSFEAAAASAQSPIRSEAHKEVQAFDRKDDFLTHSGHGKAAESGAVTPALLLSEATITLPLGADDILDPELELVDCPGLGANRSVDTLLTKEYIPRLDGAIVCLRAGAPYDAAAMEILLDLTKWFHANLESRVWVNVNQMDTTLRDAKLEGIGGETTFDVIAHLQRDYGIPLSQVFLGCTTIHELAASSPSGVADREMALLKLNLLPGDEARVDQILARHPALKNAFGELLKDGGVGYLRSLLSKQIGRSVAGDILLQGMREAGACRDEFRMALDAAVKPASEAEQTHAKSWNSFVFEMITELGGPGYDGRRGSWFALSEGLSRHLRQEMFTAFADQMPSDRMLSEMSHDEFKDRLSQDAAAVDQGLRKGFAQMVQKFYHDITAEFERRNLPEMTLYDGRSPHGVWQESVRIAREKAVAAEAVPPTLDPEVLRRLTDQRIDSESQSEHFQRLYELLGRRVRAVVYEMSLRMRTDARVRLESLRHDVRRKLSPKNRVAPSTSRDQTHA